MALSVGKSFGKDFYIELIRLLNIAVAESIISTGGTVTTALSTLATERDKQ